MERREEEGREGGRERQVGDRGREGGIKGEEGGREGGREKQGGDRVREGGEGGSGREGTE